MKHKTNKEVIALIILIPLFLIIAFVLSKYQGGQGYDYSVSAKGLSGYSIIYEALNDLGFSAYREDIELKAGVSPDLRLVAASPNFDINSENIKEWINSGGNLLILSPGGDFSVPYATGKEKISDNYFSYRYGSGRVLTADADSFTNKKLSEDSQSAYLILNYLFKSGFNKIVFNEHYLYTSEEKLSLWRDTPAGIKITIYQFILVVIFIILLKGKRFGRAVPLYEEEERVENEYVYSAASLFKKAGCYDMMLENFKDSLFYDLKKTLRLYGEVTWDNWLYIWESEKLPALNHAKAVHNDVIKAEEGKNDKQFIKAASGIEELMDVLKKRREWQWKQIAK